MVGEFRLRGAIERVDRTSGRFYVWEGKRYWSVTTITQVVPKPWMGPWKARLTAQYAVEHLEFLQNMVAEVGIDRTVDWLKREADRYRDDAALKGSRIHEAAEATALDLPRDPWTELEQPYMEGWQNWVDDWGVSFVAIEAPVFSKQHWYAGCLDAIVTLDKGKGPTVLVDYKTGKSVYAETGLQLAAYRHSETFIGLPDGDEDPTPPVDAAAVVRLDPSVPRGYEFTPLRTDQDIFDMFLYVRELFRWQEETSKTIVARRAVPAANVCARADCKHSPLVHTKAGCTVAVPLTAALKRKLKASGVEFLVSARTVPCTCIGFRARPAKREVKK